MVGPHPRSILLPAHPLLVPLLLLFRLRLLLFLPLPVLLLLLHDPARLALLPPIGLQLLNLVDRRVLLLDLREGVPLLVLGVLPLLCVVDWALVVFPLGTRCHGAVLLAPQPLLVPLLLLLRLRPLCFHGLLVLLIFLDDPLRLHFFPPIRIKLLWIELLSVLALYLLELEQYLVCWVTPLFFRVDWATIILPLSCPIDDLVLLPAQPLLVPLLLFFRLCALSLHGNLVLVFFIYHPLRSTLIAPILLGLFGLKFI